MRLSINSARLLGVKVILLFSICSVWLGLRNDFWCLLSCECTSWYDRTRNHWHERWPQKLLHRLGCYKSCVHPAPCLLGDPVFQCPPSPSLSAAGLCYPVPYASLLYSKCYFFVCYLLLHCDSACKKEFLLVNLFILLFYSYNKNYYFLFHLIFHYFLYWLLLFFHMWRVSVM